MQHRQISRPRPMAARSYCAAASGVGTRTRIRPNIERYEIPTPESFTPTQRQMIQLLESLVGDFEPTEYHNVYASFSNGFNGGGFDPRGSNFNAPDLDDDGTVSPEEQAAYIGFEPETVDNYELGYKAALFDGRLNTAIAAFQANYSDVQIPGSIACTVGGFPSFCGVVSNAGKATFKVKL